MNDNYSIIESKISEYKSKYFKNEVIKGFILFVIVLVITSLIALSIELFSYLEPSSKKILLLGYFLVNVSGLIYFLIKPLLALFGIVGKLKEKHINENIVNHFPEIGDKLWNLIELKKEDSYSFGSHELVMASIEQRIKNFEGVSFKNAVDYRKNKRFFYFLIIVIIVTVAIAGTNNVKFKESRARLINYGMEYQKPSPYKFLLLNDKLEVGKGENLALKLEVVADKEVDDVFINYGGNLYLMTRDSSFYYSYSFKNLNNSLTISFSIDEFISKQYKLEVLPKPILSAFSVDVIKPSYTRLRSESFENITELIVPVGAYCNFNFSTYATDSIIIEGSVSDTINSNINLNRRFIKDENLKISLMNKYYTENDYFSISIKTIPDDYPSIFVNQLVDSIDYTRVYFKGELIDDYGFKSLNMVTSINNEIDSSFSIAILPYLLQQNFFYAFNFSTYKGQSKQIDYYFEIEDNDQVNGSKKSVSERFTFVFPDLEDIFKYQEEKFDNIEELISESMNLTRKLQEDMLGLKEKLIDSELTEWERKEIMKDIYSKKNSLEDALMQIQEKNEEMNKYMDSFTEENEELLAKQEQIQEILDEVMSDELKKLMEEFNDIMEKFNENKMNDLAEELDVSLDDLSEQLDRNLDMLKQMKIEKQLGLISAELEEKASIQETMAEKIEGGEKPKDLIEDQKKEMDELNRLEKSYEDIEKLNKELTEPLNLYDFEEEFQKIRNEFMNSLENQERNNKKKSNSSMRKNKDNMESLAFMMNQMKENAFQKQNAESLENIVTILENTLIFSFEQEKIVKPNGNNTFDVFTMKMQKKLYTDFQVIKDSLYSLAKRQPSINMAVNKEIVAIENGFRTIEKDFAEDRVSKVNVAQLKVLESSNNLALFLSEVIKQMQNQMANSKPGNQNCEKPGNNPNPNSMSNSLKGMQQSLQQQMEKMMQMMKQGGESGSMQGEMGKALSQQEKMQNMLQRMMNQGQVGSGSYETLKEAEQLLNKVRDDLIRNNLSDMTINRQKEIMTRLLEAENADNERDLDEKRKSESADDFRISETAKQFDNDVTNDNFNEKLIKNRLILNKFYQDKYQFYINILDSINVADN